MKKKKKTLLQEILFMAKWFFVFAGILFIAVLILAEAKETRFRDIHTARVEATRGASCQKELRIYKEIVTELTKK